ncbi:MAG: DUF2442 domain-containing protein [Chitinivibrionales bacterium]|nr:DUF2442 domain-containing protein [Chitinivibrionales bacterium]
MKSSKSRRSTSAAEVSNITIHGIWLLLEDREYFLPFRHFPWFRDATIAQIQNIQVMDGAHLHWPDLDVDLSRDMLETSESYPLVWKEG